MRLHGQLYTLQQVGGEALGLICPLTCVLPRTAAAQKHSGQAGGLLHSRPTRVTFPPQVSRAGGHGGAQGSSGCLRSQEVLRLYPAYPFARRQTHMLCRTHQPQWGSRDPRHSSHDVYCTQLSTGTRVTYWGQSVSPCSPTLYPHTPGKPQLRPSLVPVPVALPQPWRFCGLAAGEPVSTQVSNSTDDLWFRTDVISPL